MADARLALERNQMYADALQSKINALWADFTARDDPAQRAIVMSVHQLATALGLAVVAEGVENERTAADLNQLRGTIGQGWYFGRPVSAQVFEEEWHLQPHGQ